jgi:hypothetical protein
MTSPTPSSPAATDAALLVRQRRRTIVVLVAAVLMGALWWMGQPPVPVGEPDRSVTEQAASTPEPTSFQEWYAGGRISVSGRIVGEAEPVIELVSLQPPRGDAPAPAVELLLSDQGSWTDWRELSQDDLKAAGFRHTAGSRGPRHVWEQESTSGVARGVLTVGFGDSDLQSVSVGGARHPPGEVVDAPVRIRIDGQPVGLPMLKSRFVEMFGEPSPPLERRRRSPPSPEGAETPIEPDADRNPSSVPESPQP